MRTATIAGLNADIAGEEHGPNSPLVVLLHGYDGFAKDFSPFAPSLGLPLHYVFPESALRAATSTRGGNAWWPADDEGRREAQRTGQPRDLSSFIPDGLDGARAALSRLLDEIGSSGGPRPLVLGGFSQGAMLACDFAVRCDRPLAGLVLFSGARICGDAWSPLFSTRRGLPVFMSHGRSDGDLSFAAADRLRADLVAAGLEVTWVPFDGGHEVPLIAFRGLKRFLSGIVRR
jgi:phospholipase/carboxylesterase